MSVADLRAAVRASLPRVLALADRAPLSPTAGCADRPYWHYRADKDFPSATYAQIAWPLALLAVRPELGGADLPHARLARTALDAMRWWASVQHPDGSFDEWFPYERSQVATAFTTLGIAEAALALGARFAASPARGAVLRALERAALWLERNPDLDVANHAAGAVAALASVEALLPGRGRAGAERAAGALARLQDEEGFFPEYGGADPGYGTVTLAHLARAAVRLPSLDLTSPLSRLERFLACFVAPDGSYGGETGRRATRYAWLSGFALRAASSPLAAAILEALLAGLARGSLPSPGAFDDRYLAFFAFPDAVAALAAISDGTRDGRAPAALPQEALYPRAGLGVLCAGELRLAIGVRVGGALKLHLAAPATDAAAGARLLHDDCGYVARLADGRLASSWCFGATGDLSPRSATSSTRFALWSRQSPVARHPVLLRLFFHTAGRLPGPSRRLARAARARFTTRPGPAPLHLERRVGLAATGLRVEDRIAIEPGVRVTALERAIAFAPVHVPSAPLWLPAFEPLAGGSPADLAAHLVPGRPLVVVTTIERTRGGFHLRVTADNRVVEEERREI